MQNIMIHLPESLETLWYVWLVCAFVCLAVTVQALKSLRWRHLKKLATEEDGAAYTLSYVMVIPIYMLLMCMMIETPLIMSAKVGTIYAGYASGRSASVWASAGDWEQAEKKAKMAALKAFIPFSSGTQPLISGGLPSPDQRRMLTKYGLAWTVVNGLNGELELPEYVVRKASYAIKNMKVEIEEPESWDSDITVNVTYDFPFNVPGIGRLLGERRTLDGRHIYKLTTQVIVHNESPQNDDQTLGIGYGTFE